MTNGAEVAEDLRSHSHVLNAATSSVVLRGYKLTVYHTITHGTKIPKEVTVMEYCAGLYPPVLPIERNTKYRTCKDCGLSTKY